MSTTIALLLFQDGLTSGLIYALLALSILLVFVVTRVLWVPAGDFLVFGALTFALLQKGEIPGTVWLCGALGCATAVVETWRAWRSNDWHGWRPVVAISLGTPLLVGGTVYFLAASTLSLAVQVLLTLALIVPMGFMLYRIAFRPLADKSVLILMFVAIAVHYCLVGLGLLFFGSEGYRTSPFIASRIDAGITSISWQLVLVLAASGILMIGLWLFTGRTLWGKALRATAVNRFGARLVGIRTETMGAVTFTIAALIGAFSGILISPVTTLFYDSGFLIALKGFVGAVVAGMASFPLAVIGAVVVGVVESFSSFYASALKEAIVFALLIPFLLWRSAVEPRRHETHEHDE
ncbi:MAG TPA: branched-chain amino acid ABC transporter permease [Bradyrhizobium sp.]|nr:branched-chain amino acid ABC transporter permease [Bradyrhizobium sp.]